MKTDGTMASENNAAETETETTLTVENKENLVELIPVPDDDISRCAKPNCLTCHGRGKLIIRPPNSKESRTIVCRCAYRRFIAENQSRLSVGKDRQLYYRKLPDEMQENEALKETEVSEAVVPAGDAGRLQVMRDRVTALDVQIAEISSRYDRQFETRMAAVEAAEESLARELKTSRDLVKQQSEIISQITSKKEEIKKLEVSLDNARKNLDLLEQKHEECVAQQISETTRVAPFAQSLENARSAVTEMSKKRNQALMPHRQRRKSLVKRMTHKAASLGMTLDVPQDNTP